MNVIHQNHQRNQMTHDSLNSQMDIRLGVESEKVVSECSRCEKNATPNHCHCSLFNIEDPDLKQKCRDAWLKCRISQQTNAEEKSSVFEDRKDKREEVMRKETERIVRLKQDLKVKPSCFSKKLLEPVYSSR